MDKPPFLIQPKLIVPPIAMPLTESGSSEAVFKNRRIAKLDVPVVIGPKQPNKDRSRAKLVPLSTRGFKNLNRLQPRIMRSLMAAEAEYHLKSPKLARARKSMAVLPKVLAISSERSGHIAITLVGKDKHSSNAACQRSSCLAAALRCGQMMLRTFTCDACSSKQVDIAFSLSPPAATIAFTTSQKCSSVRFGAACR